MELRHLEVFVAVAAELSFTRASSRLHLLAGEPFIDYPPGWGTRAIADRAFAAAGLDREVPFEAAEYTAAINLIRGSLGLAFLPASVAAGQGADLALIEISDHAFSWCISVVAPAGRRMSAAARAFLKKLPAPPLIAATDSR